MRAWIGCSLIVFLAACSGSATPHSFSQDGDGTGDGTGDGNGDGTGDGTGDGSGDGGSGGGGGGGSGVVPPASTQLSTKADVTQVNFYQATEVVTVKAGAAATHSTPIVAGRPALVRVFVTPKSGSTSVTAQLRFEDGTGKALDQLTKTQTIASASTASNTNSTINFDVPAADLVEGGKYSVALVDSSAAEVSTGTSSTARFPADGSLGATGAKNTGVLKVTLIPVVVSGGVAPDTSTAQIKTLHDTMFALYPVTDVQITVHAQMSYSGTVSATSSQGFENVLEWATSLRQSENPPDDVYYWATFNPKSSFNSFCGGGCIAGLS
ncbi:MAG TPA: hypothetical protein VF407_20335, partial [Polyangiaceae bacterium]